MSLPLTEGNPRRLRGHSPLVVQRMMMHAHRLLPLLALGCAVLPLCPLAAQVPAAVPENLQIFLLMGQSNMAGRGQVEEEDKVPIPGIFSLNRELAWVPAVEPVHFDRPFVGSGLGRPFAKALLEANPSVAIGLVPCALGGSSLKQWTPGDKLYTEALTRARAALKSGKLKGILWHQGESDSGTEELARSYRERWTGFIDSLRRDLDAPEVPVLVGQLGEFLYRDNGGASLHARIVNEQLALIPLSVPKTAFVLSAGLNHKGDKVHFDRAALHELGRRYALAYLGLDADWARRSR